MYKFSIITACHNKGVFIEKCVQSVINQTYDNWEHIIVDDCSTDDSYRKLLNFSDRPEITILRNESRKYCSSSYARALNQATGDICGVLDADDCLDESAMHVISKRYARYPGIDWIYTQFHWCNRKLKNPRDGVSSLPKNGKPLTDMTLSGKHCYSHWRTFRRSIAKDAILFPEGLRVSVDKSLGFNLEELGRGAFCPQKLYFYRYYKGNMSLIYPEDQKNTTMQLAKYHNLKRKKNNIKVYPIIKIK